MARPMNKLSVRETQRDLTPGLYGDGGGLYLQVSSLISTLRHTNGKTRQRSSAGIGCTVFF